MRNTLQTSLKFFRPAAIALALFATFRAECKDLTVGFAQVGAESSWRTAETDSIKSEAAKRHVTLKFSDAQGKQENRRAWAKRCNGGLKVPEHFCVARGSTRHLDENEAIEFTGLVDAIASSEHVQDFVVVDTAGTDNHLTRLAHSLGNAGMQAGHLSRCARLPELHEVTDCFPKEAKEKRASIALEWKPPPKNGQRGYTPPSPIPCKILKTIVPFWNCSAKS